MRGISVATTSLALVLVALAILAVVVPFFWTSVVDAMDALGRTVFTQTLFLSSDVYIIPPPALNPGGGDQVVLVFNSGAEALTGVKVLAIKPDLNVVELNITVVRKNGAIESVGSVLDSFFPGDLIVGRVPGDTDYRGWRMVLQSNEYSESVGVG